MQANNQLAKTNGTPTALVEIAQRMGVNANQAYNTIKETVAPKAKPEELLAFCVVANQYKLNPFLKEIYAFPGKSGGIVPIVGIDGWLKLINTHPQFDGMEVIMSGDGSECTCRIYRKGNSHPTEITEYLSECQQNTQPWKQMPKRMLRHKAIIQCGRVAFGFGGIYDDDEGRIVAENMRNVTPEKESGNALFSTPKLPSLPQSQVAQASTTPHPEPEPEAEPEQDDDFIPGLEDVPEAVPSFGSYEH